MPFLLLSFVIPFVLSSVPASASELRFHQDGLVEGRLCSGLLENFENHEISKFRAARFRLAYNWTRVHGKPVQPLFPMAKEALENESELLLKAYQGKLPSQHIVIIGSGAHGAILNMALQPAIEKGLMVLNIDQDYPGKTFIEAGDSFRINSPEGDHGNSTNILFGSVAVAHFERERFVTAGSLGKAILFTHASSGGSYRIGDSVRKITYEPLGLKRFVVHLESGLSVRTSAVVYAGGFTSIGRTSTHRLPDLSGVTAPRNQATLNRDLPEEWDGTGVVTAQQFLTWTTNNPAALLRLKSKRVTLVGGGDFANCVVEKIAAIDPEKYLQLSWFGKPRESFEDFLARTKPRYHNQAFEPLHRSLFESPPGQLFPEQVHQIKEERVPGQEHQFQFTVSSASPHQRVSSDLVILATGYDYSPERFLPSYLPDELAVMDPVYGSQGEVLGRQIGLVPPILEARFREQLYRPAPPFYIVGTAAGISATEPESRGSVTMNSQSLNVLGPRTYRLGQRLARELGFGD